MLSKKAVTLPVKAIISIVIIVFMILIFMSVFSNFLFLGPEYTALDDLHDAMSNICLNENSKTELSVFIPYSNDRTGSQVTNARRFLYSLKNTDEKFRGKNTLQVYSLAEDPNSIGGDFVQWIARVEDKKIEKQKDINSCRSALICLTKAYDSRKGEEVECVENLGSTDFEKPEIIPESRALAFNRCGCGFTLYSPSQGDEEQRKLTLYNRVLNDGTTLVLIDKEL